MADRGFERLYRTFPALEKTGGQLTSPPTPLYNCIAWAAGDQTRWWWPGGYWPPGVPALVELDAFVQAFATQGYEVCADGSIEIGFEKVAIYCHNGKPTHAARQLASGAWTSKLGSAVDIEHRGVEGVEGEVGPHAYGSVSKFLRRDRKR